MKEEIPPCNIRIDKEGNWYYKGVPMIRKDICTFFYQHLSKEQDGGYLLHIGDDKCYLEVEDAPFIVKRVDFHTDFKILINDDTIETLQPDTLSIGGDSVLYCKVKDRQFDARFSRPSYYQFAEYISCDKDEERFFVHLDGVRYYLKQRDD